MIQEISSYLYRNRKSNPWYLDGFAEGQAIGLEKGFKIGFETGLKLNHKIIALLLKTGQFSLQEIADQADLPLEFVQGVQDEMDWHALT